MLEFPHPPNFIKEILVSEHRALLEDFHEAHMNYTLTANLPPYVNLPRNAPHVAILEELHKANVDPATGIGLPVLRGLLNDVKRLIYDGSHTLSFGFYSKRAAQSWVKKALRFQRAVISLHDTVRRPQDEGTAGALGLAALARAMSQFAGAKVLDVEYPRSQKTDIYDNRFHKVKFAQAKCPDALMGVTRVDLNGTMITLHHFQANLRFPCTRCFNARHSAKMCKVPGRLLAKTQARFSRVYKGEVTKVTPAGDSAYRVNSVTELLALFTAQQDELAQNGSALLERTEVVTTANDTSSIAPSASSPALTTPADVRLDAASSLTARDDGFAVKRSKKDQRAVKKTEQTSHSTQSAAKNAKTSAAVGAKTSKSSTKQKPSAKAKSRTKQATGFAAFQRAEALGQYGPLADDDSDEDDSVDDDMDISDSEVHHHDDDEAPYAYADSTGERHATDMEVDTNFPGDSPEDAGVATAHEERQRDDDQERVVVKKKARRDVPTVAAAANPDAVAIASTELVQRSMADYVHTSQAIIDSEAEIVTAASTEILPPSPASDEEFTMGAPHAGTEVGDSDLPIPLPLWLKDFQGNPVDVAANGQCAILALHATTTNYDGQLLPKTSKVTRGANKLKRFVYTIMLANLHKDVELGLVDPVSEIRRLYPNRQHGDGIASATASLFNHYIQERDRCVSATVPSSFWAGTHELRAMAQYMREPLLVLDVDEHGDAHVHIYMYKTYRTSSGSDHESGYSKVLNDRAAKAYLEECGMLHTVPTFLILYHDKHHFNGTPRMSG
ncbi:hypothetical protein PHYSODRAFT_305732 [Phytophthora sojae]|uniref:OTU domain-containing protein n=1 Tax=Phytophthora sojae (strain P6497) TaxID=1094619 RepID=G5A6B6_PHYSP|nr:hypothetical protein PHYSODRAFT_305732 [Phytophthora sojae]EGZ08871.1 hypothetical protein PHYSODRAFT_305732 [Phytophthora sojae]|eukprot:XP_009535504.1 hypothetical protein PHYSODRAFT_305732 [Phytophthora sojae]